MRYLSTQGVVSLVVNEAAGRRFHPLPDEYERQIVSCRRLVGFKTRDRKMIIRAAGLICPLLMSNAECLDGLGQANRTLIWHIFGSETRLIGVHRSRCPGHLKAENPGGKR